MRVFYTDTAKLQLKQFDKPVQERIVTKVACYAAKPNPLEFGEHLTGFRAYRFPIGRYRAVFQIENNLLVVVAVQRRDEVYREL
jgi:mRNA-degrading endonuclease RelE of RelBE toxin-antitoxin system